MSSTNAFKELKWAKAAIKSYRNWQNELAQQDSALIHVTVRLNLFRRLWVTRNFFWHPPSQEVEQHFLWCIEALWHGELKITPTTLKVVDDKVSAQWHSGKRHNSLSQRVYAALNSTSATFPPFSTCTHFPATAHIWKWLSIIQCWVCTILSLPTRPHEKRAHWEVSLARSRAPKPFRALEFPYKSMIWRKITRKYFS